MSKNSPDGTLFERFMIIIFGAAIVILGAYPLTREYGGVTKYLNSKFSQIAKYMEAGEQTNSRRGRLKEPKPQTKSVSKKNSSEINQKNRDEPLDPLSNSDRQELDSLIDSVIK